MLLAASIECRCLPVKSIGSGSVDNAGVSQPHLLYHIHFMAAISLLHGRLLAMHHDKIPFTLATCLIHDNESSGDY